MTENVSTPIIPEEHIAGEPKTGIFYSKVRTFFNTSRYLKITGIIVILAVLVSPGIYYAMNIKKNKTSSIKLVTKKVASSPTPTATPSATIIPTQQTIQQSSGPTPTPDFHVSVDFLENGTPVPQSTTPTVQPTSAPASQISVSVSGTVFSDDNCNGSRDGNESTLSNVSVTVYYNNPPTYQNVGSLTTDSGGNFSWSKSINQNDSYPVQLNVLSPSGYKSDPKQGGFSLVLNSSNPNGSWAIGEVPDANVSSMCNN